jgi:hypothetical protein
MAKNPRDPARHGTARALAQTLEPSPSLERLLRMTVEPEILYALGLFALVGGRVCGGIQWHHWNRQRRRRESAPSEAAPKAA